MKVMSFVMLSLRQLICILLQTSTSALRAVQDVALTPAAATSPEDSRAPAMTDMPETAQPARVSNTPFTR